MNYLIIGGSKSGKSGFGEELAITLNKNKVVYVATMKPYDDEDKKRIQIHIQNRAGFKFVTIEKQEKLHEITSEIDDKDTVLIDSITSLLTNEMFKEGKIISEPSKNILYGLKEVMNRAKNTVIISDYIFNDALEFDEVTENFKRELGIINKELAKNCDKVIECSFGNIKYHK